MAISQPALRSKRGMQSSAVGKTWMLLGLIVLLVLLTLAATAGASNKSEPKDAAGLPGSGDFITAIDAGGTAPVMPTETNPNAARGLPLQDLNRDEALSLLEGVFDTQLQAPAGVFDELEVRRLLSSTIAVVAEPGEAPSEDSHGIEDPAEGEDPDEVSDSRLLISTLPLVTNGTPTESEVVDLSLQADEGGLAPGSPLVAVEIPDKLEEGIWLPGPDVGIRLATEAGDRQPSVIAESVAAYPNVSVDTDLAVAPTPTGVETLTQLRGPDSPKTQLFHLDLPHGAALFPSPDGGAAVMKEGATLVGIAPPTAIDAEGNAVPVAFGVEGDSLLLTASPDASAKFPILVDPLFQTYEWEKLKSTESGICNSSHEPTTFNQCNRREEWGYEQEEKYPLNLHVGNQFSGTAPLYVPQGTPGIYLRSSGEMTVGDRGTVLYAVPRFFKDLEHFGESPKSYIASMTLSKLLWQAYSSGPSPYLFAGLWDSIKPGWTSYYSHQGGVDRGLNDMTWPYIFSNDTDPGPNVEPNKNVKVGAVSIQATETRPYSNTSVYVGAATIELGDQEVPQAPVPSLASAWVHQSPTSIGFTAQDKGLGVYAIEASTQPGASGKPIQRWKAARGCKGVAGAACPRIWKSSESGHQELKYDPSDLSAGISFLRLVVEDPVGNRSAPAWVEAKVDHAPPNIAVSGDLVEQASIGPNLPEYTLNYTASDGDDAPAAAQTPIGSGGTGPGQMDKPIGVEIDSAGNVWSVDRANRRVQKFSPSGSLLAQFPLGSIAGSPVAEARDLAVTPAGDIWISDAATKAIIKYSPTGQVLTGFTHSSFIEPFGMAEGPEGAIWVTDLLSQSLYKFSAAGELLKRIQNKGGIPLAIPLGIDIDTFGGVWVTERATNRIVRLEPDGSSAIAFGGPGSGDGQLLEPAGLAVAPSGNILVVDSGNNRVQVFKPDGTFLRKFGTLGAGNGQLNGARGIAVASDRTAFIADGGNQRIARWEHADKDPQSGAAKVEIKVDGTSVKTEAPGCATKNCSISGSWTLDADEYPVGPHKVEVIATDGVGLSTTKTLDVETYGDRFAPTLALSGSMTQQATLGTTRPAYTLNVRATDLGTTKERKSGVAATVIKVDGEVVDSASPGCPAGGCSIDREWTLDSDSYAVGPHTVAVEATDEAGRSTSKTLEIQIARDTTAPEFNSLYDGFYKAPKGWLEQKSILYIANSTDAGGYGVTSMQLKIDGIVVDSVSGICPSGGCGKSFGFLPVIDMSEYAGGAHPAELIATDGAGNTRKRTWTINVVPKGQIPKEELTATLEAVEATSSANPIGEPQVEEAVEGSSTGIGIVKADETFESTGTAVPLTIEPEATDGFTVSVAEAGAFMTTCSQLEPEEENTPINSETCSPPSDQEVGSGTDLLPVTVTPAATAAGAGDHTSVDGNSTVAQNTAEEADSILRPLYEGALSFQHIRGVEGPQEYSWKVDLHEGMYLHAPDNQAVEVRYAGGQLAFTVATEPAHDAVGTTVPTDLSVGAGGVITLHVRHKGQPFVYPVVAGTGWQGGFFTNEIEGPLDEQEQREEEERIAREAQEARERGESDLTEEQVADLVYEETKLRVKVSAMSPPLWNASKDSPYPPRKFVFSECHYPAPIIPIPKYPGPRRRYETAEGVRGIVGSCLIKGQDEDLIAAIGLAGWFHYINGKKVWVNENEYFACSKWGHHQPALVNCGRQPKWSYSGITVRGDYKWAQDPVYRPIGPECETFYGHLNASPPHKVIMPQMYTRLHLPGERCPWPSWPGGG